MPAPPPAGPTPGPRHSPARRPPPPGCSRSEWGRARRSRWAGARGAAAGGWGKEAGPGRAQRSLYPGARPCWPGLSAAPAGPARPGPARELGPGQCGSGRLRSPPAASASPGRRARPQPAGQRRPPAVTSALGRAGLGSLGTCLLKEKNSGKQSESLSCLNFGVAQSAVHASAVKVKDYRYIRAGL